MKAHSDLNCSEALAAEDRKYWINEFVYPRIARDLISHPIWIRPTTTTVTTTVETATTDNATVETATTENPTVETATTDNTTVETANTKNPTVETTTTDDTTVETVTMESTTLPEDPVIFLSESEEQSLSSAPFENQLQLLKTGK